MSMWPPTGGNWEGGYTDPQGRRWRHVPWLGWQRVTTPPFFRPAKRRRWNRLIANWLRDAS